MKNVYMKKNIAKIFIVYGIVGMCSCNPSNFGGGNITSFDGYEDRFTQDEHKLVDFKNGLPQGYELRNDWGNGTPFNCSFSRDNIKFENGTMDLFLTKGEKGYKGAEFRSYKYYEYGFFSVKMKPAKCPGVISSFFVYTGFPWHEIDIEFLGNDTTKVQFNHYTDGVGHHEYLYDLGFDASLDYHEYAFLWEKDSLVYYVDGKAVYKTTDNVPSKGGKIMMNLWNVDDSHKEWAGKFDDTYLPVNSSYKWIGYQSS